MNYVTDKRVMAYLSSFPKRPKKDLKTVFPAAGDDALDLLSKTIKFSV